MGPIPDPIAADLARVWGQRLDGEYLTEDLPDKARVILATRLDLLNVAFKQHADDELRPVLTSMLRPYWGRTAGSPSDYLYVLRMTVPAPSWAALEAISRVMRGLLPKAEYCPIPGHLRAIAWGVASPFFGERFLITKILRARPPRREESQEHRRNVAERITTELRSRAGFQVGYQRLALDSCRSSHSSSCKNRNTLNLPEF